MLLWTNGRHVNYHANSRYQLKSQVLQGNASLTIENVNERDRGLYCCRVETKGWGGVQTLNVSLQVQPGKLALFLFLVLARELSLLFAGNLFFAWNMETRFF